MLPFQIVDSHVHLWDPDRHDYPWLSQVPELKKARHLSDLDAERSDVVIEKLVAIEADVDPRHALEEARWLSELATEDARIGAIVAQAPLEAGEAARAHLEKLREIPGVVGVRRLLQDREVDFCLTEDFGRGIDIASKLGFHFEICARHHQLQSVISLVRLKESTRFVLDHIGKPDIKGRNLDPWSEHITTLASLPNVTCKLSGLVTEADLEKWKPFKLKPFIDHVLESFGFERVLFGSDWPVQSLASTYSAWIDAVIWAIDGCRESEMMRLFRSNALAVYGLET